MLLPGYIPTAILIKMGLLGFYFSCPVFDKRLLFRQLGVKVKAKDLDKLQRMQYKARISKDDNLNNKSLGGKRGVKGH